MLVLRVALRNLGFRPVLTAVTLALLGLAVAQETVVVLLARAFEAGLVRASRPFDLLVGAKGSPTPLLMSTVLLQDAPVGNLPLAYFEQLQHDPRVAYAVPLAMGDSAYGTPLLVGVLAPSDTPWDRALFVPLASYWEVHQEHAAAEPEITVALLRPKGVKEFYQLHQEINRQSVAQAVLTGHGMMRLFDMLGQGETVLRLTSWLALAMGAATVFLVSYAVGAQRQRDTAILRALGAGRWAMCSVGLAEALVTALIGTVLGMAAGHATAWYISWRVHDASAIILRPTCVPAEFGIAGAVLLLAAVAGLLPAVQVYRQDVASNL